MRARAMLDWLKGQADHPLATVDETTALLARLPIDRPQEALSQVTGWLTSLGDDARFRLDRRMAVVRLLDDAGRPLEGHLSRQLLAGGDAEPESLPARRLWQAVHEFWQATAHAYEVCLSASEGDPQSATAARRAELPLIGARAARAIGYEMKTRYIRGLPAEGSHWQRLGTLLRLGERHGWTGTRLRAYPREAVETSLLAEILKPLLLAVAAPETLAPEDVEIAFRTTARYAPHFSCGSAADPACPYAFDLNQPNAPSRVPVARSGKAGERYFGAREALPRLKEMLGQHEQGIVADERRFGTEYPIDRKIAVLRHLLDCWGGAPGKQQGPEA